MPVVFDDAHSILGATGSDLNRAVNVTRARSLHGSSRCNCPSTNAPGKTFRRVDCALSCLSQSRLQCFLPLFRLVDPLCDRPAHVALPRLTRLFAYSNTGNDRLATTTFSSRNARSMSLASPPVNRQGCNLTAACPVSGAWKESIVGADDILHVSMSRLLPPEHLVLAQTTSAKCQIGAHKNRSKSADITVRDVLKPTGSDRGADRVPFMATLIMSAKLNDIDPQVLLADVIARIADTPITRLEQLLPWNWTPPTVNAQPA